MLLEALSESDFGHHLTGLKSQVVACMLYSTSVSVSLTLEVVIVVQYQEAMLGHK